MNKISSTDKDCRSSYSRITVRPITISITDVFINYPQFVTNIWIDKIRFEFTVKRRLKENTVSNKMYHYLGDDLIKQNDT